jgi:hypothetical protein
MALDEFTGCFAQKVGTTVDGVLELTNQLGEEGIRTVRDTWNSLNEESRKVIKWIAAVSVSALTKILEKVFGVSIAAPLIVFLGGVSWGILIGSLIACADQFLG